MRCIFLLDHIFITVTDLDRSIAFYEKALKPLGIVHSVDYDDRDGSVGHPDLKGFGAGRPCIFLAKTGDCRRQGRACRLRCQK